ncbi:hypothetical protein MYX82_08780 [Acidobacteria bacterium AH-259-D05]|nr:hypothetical protein [Acidobacteria bacterium AH-259-D05]
MAHPQIAAFARLANGQTPPTRLIAGQATKLSRTMHDIRFDHIHDEIFVSNPFAQAIMAFRGSADGEEAPIRVIQGSKTQLVDPDRLDVDPVHNEIFVPNQAWSSTLGGPQPEESILVFRREAEGNVAPIRVIKGPNTQLQGVRAVAVDPVNNLLIAGTDLRRPGEQSGLLIFDRTADGDVKPLRIIRGPNTGIIRITQMQVYSPGGWIVASQPGRQNVQEPEGAFIGIWSIYDDGDVPPRWLLGGPKSRMKKPRGVALNPENKELIVADMRANAVFTYYFPELFETKSRGE